MNKIQKGVALGVSVLTSACAPLNKAVYNIVREKKDPNTLNIDWSRVRLESNELLPHPIASVTDSTSQQVESSLEGKAAFLETEKRAMQTYLENGHKLFFKMISERKLAPIDLEGKVFGITLTLDRLYKKITINIGYSSQTDLVISGIDLIKSSPLSPEETHEIHKMMTHQEKVTNEIIAKIRSGEMAESDL